MWRGHQPVEQVTVRGEPLLELGAASLRVPHLDPGGDVHRLDGADRRHAAARAPGLKELIRGAGISPARVRVANVGREEFEEAHSGALAGGGDKHRKRTDATRREAIRLRYRRKFGAHAGVRSGCRRM